MRVDNIKVAPLPPLSFTVANGECLAVEGPSGAGKTRLLRAIADLDDADGHVFLDGAERREVTGPEWRRRVRYAASEPAWWTDTARSALVTVREARPEKLERLVTGLGLDTKALDRPVGELSTGERQRLAFLRALADEPQVLLLDEPTNGLDPQAAALVEELIKFQLLAGRSIILASHDGHQIERLADVRLQLAKPLRPPRDSKRDGKP